MNQVEVESLSGKELVALHNRLTGEDVKRFANHATGVRRVLAAYKAQEQAAPAAAEKPAPSRRERPALAAKATAAPAPAVASPAVQEAASVSFARKPAPRSGSKRAALLEALHSPDGITTEAMQSRFEWTIGDCRDAMRLLRVRNGVQFARGEDGVWRAR